MGLLITNRNKASISYYKEIIIGIIKTYTAGFERIVISSGFFDENALNQKNKYKRTLIEAINENGKIDRIDLVGTFLYWRFRKWPKCTYAYKKYESFVKKLRGGVTGKTNINAYYYKKGNWHAKVCVFIPKGKKDWAIVIVGSSNMTCPVFWSGTTKSESFNVESDVTIWKDCFDDVFRNIINNFADKTGVWFQSNENVESSKVDVVVNKILDLIANNNAVDKIDI